MDTDSFTGGFYQTVEKLFQFSTPVPENRSRNRTFIEHSMRPALC